MTFFPDLFYVIKFILLCRKKRDGDGDTVSLNEMALSAAAENGSISGVAASASAERTKRSRPTRIFKRSATWTQGKTRAPTKKEIWYSESCRETNEMPCAPFPMARTRGGGSAA